MTITADMPPRLKKRMRSWTRIVILQSVGVTTGTVISEAGLALNEAQLCFSDRPQDGRRRQPMAYRSELAKDGQYQCDIRHQTDADSRGFDAIMQRLAMRFTFGFFADDG